MKFHRFLALLIGMCFLDLTNGRADPPTENEDPQEFYATPAALDLKNKPQEKVEISTLRPTQLYLGMFEVEKRTQEIEQMSGKDFDEYRKAKIVPVVKGPDGKYYIIDHHHFVRSVQQGRPGKKVFISIQEDWSELSEEDFWKRMQGNQWACLYDKNGEKIPYQQLPKTIGDMTDDPLRSALWIARKRGLWNRLQIPFEEFKMAHYLRTQGHITEDLDVKNEGQLGKFFETLKKVVEKMQSVICVRDVLK